MKLIKRLLLFALAVLFLAAAGLLLFITNADFTRFAGILEAEIEGAVGLDIQIKGPIEAGLFSSRPWITLNDLRLRQATSNGPKELGRIRKARIDLRLLPLLSGRLRIERIVLDQPQIRVATNEGWQSRLKSMGSKSKAPKLELGGSWVKALHVVGGQITLHGNSATDPTVLHLKQLTVEAENPSSPIRFSATGSLDGRQFHFAGRLGSITGILRYDRADISFGTRLGNSSFEGKVRIETGPKTKITGTVAIRRLDLRGLTYGKSALVQKDSTVPARALRSISGELAVTATQIQFDTFNVVDAHAKIALGDGVLMIKPVTGRLSGGRLTADARLDTSVEPPRLEVNLNFAHKNIGELKDLFPFDRRITGQVRAVLAARASGNTASAIEAGLRATPLTVNVQGLSLANAPWGSRRPMARVKRLELSLKLGDLFENRIRIIRLLAVEPDIHLETDRKGKGNWAIQHGAQSSGKAPASVPAVRELVVERGRIVYRDRIGGQTRRIRADTLRAVSVGKQLLTYRFQFSGTADGQSLRTRGTIGPLSALATARPMKLAFAAKRGKSDLSAKLTIRGRDPVQVNGSLLSNRLDFGNPTPERQSDQMLPSNEPIPVGTLRSISGRVSLRAKRIRFGSLVVYGVSASAAADDGILKIPQIAGKIAKGNLSGHFLVDASTSRPRIELGIDIKHLVLGKVASAARRVAPDDLLDASVRVKGQGQSLREIAATLDGQVRLSFGRGRVSEATGFFLDLGSEIMSSITNIARIRGGSIRCAAARLVLRDGIGRSEILLIDTERFTFVGQGTFNFKSQTVDAIFYPRNKVPLARRVKPFAVRIRGPIRQPQTRIDAVAGAAQTGRNIVGLLKLPVKLVRSIFGDKTRGIAPPALARPRSQQRHTAWTVVVRTFAGCRFPHLSDAIR